MTRNGIAVAGTILFDEINEIEAYPAAGELVKIKTVSRASGGCVPNVGVDLAVMRPDVPVLAIGKVGDDDGANFVCGVMQKAPQASKQGLSQVSCKEDALCGEWVLPAQPRSRLCVPG